jgi:hypothetical protein
VGQRSFLSDLFGIRIIGIGALHLRTLQSALMAGLAI